MNFTKTVTLPQRNADGILALGPDNQPLVQKTLGTFTFKEPNFAERKAMNIRINHDIALAGGFTDLLKRVYDQIQAAATLPVVVVEPKDFDLNPLSDEEVDAIYAAFQEGIGEVSPKNG